MAEREHSLRCCGSQLGDNSSVAVKTCGTGPHWDVVLRPGGTGEKAGSLFYYFLQHIHTCKHTHAQHLYEHRHTNPCTHIYTCTYMHTHEPTCKHIYRYIEIHSCIHVYKHTLIHTSINKCTYIHTWALNIEPAFHALKYWKLSAKVSLPLFKAPLVMVKKGWLACFLL